MVRTKQKRAHRSMAGGQLVMIEHTYFDKPASVDTWLEHVPELAAEFGISTLEAHQALFAQLPEIFGR